MIGTDIRGIRHLWRLSDSSLKGILVNFKDCGQKFCHVFKTDGINGDKLFILNNVVTNCDVNVSTILSQNILSEDETKYAACTYRDLIMIDKSRIFHNDISFINSMTLLPDDFDSQYEKFLSDNAKMIRSLTNKYGYGVNDDISKLMYIYTDGSKNFYQWAISSRFQCNTPLSVIRSIMLWNEGYGQMAKNLSKNTITAYTTSSGISSLLGELRELRQCKRINDAINSFNTAQKKILREKKLTDKDKETLSKFWRLSGAKKLNFIKKVSTIDNFDEIMRLMRHITTIHFEWNKESFMDFISNVEGMKYETVFDNGNIVLIKVGDFETVKNLARTTNWCISKNKTYWNQYVEHNYNSTQYIIFDFSKREDDLLSIVGFTTEHNKGITHAHDFTNNDIMKKNDEQSTDFINSFVQKFMSTNDIYSVLKSCGIDINLVAHYDKPLFEWNRESMFDYLFGCVDKCNVDVLLDKGNKVVLSVVDENIRYFLGDAYMDNLPSESWGYQHIIFMDFNMNEYDPNRMSIALIRRGRDKREEDFCCNMMNANMENSLNSFDLKLSQYGLPHNIIRRRNNKLTVISSMFISGNIPDFKSAISGISKKDVREAVLDYIGCETFCNKVSFSLTSLMTFDYLDAIYDNGIKMIDLVGETNVATVINNVIVSIVLHGNNTNKLFKTPTREEIDKFMRCELDTLDETYYVGLYLALEKIMEHEKGGNTERLYKRLLRFLLASNNIKPGDMLDRILMVIGEQIDNKHNEFLITWAKCVKRYGGERVNNILNGYLKIRNMSIEDDTSDEHTLIDLSAQPIGPDTFGYIDDVLDTDEFIEEEEPAESLY